VRDPLRSSCSPHKRAERDRSDAASEASSYLRNALIELAKDGGGTWHRIVAKVGVSGIALKGLGISSWAGWWLSNSCLSSSPKTPRVGSFCWRLPAVCARRPGPKCSGRPRRHVMANRETRERRRNSADRCSVRHTRSPLMRMVGVCANGLQPWERDVEIFRTESTPDRTVCS
jgi:hypothetical protein